MATLTIVIAVRVYLLGNYFGDSIYRMTFDDFPERFTITTMLYMSFGFVGRVLVLRSFRFLSDPIVGYDLPNTRRQRDIDQWGYFEHFVYADEQPARRPRIRDDTLAADNDENEEEQEEDAAERRMRLDSVNVDEHPDFE